MDAAVYQIIMSLVGGAISGGALWAILFRAARDKLRESFMTKGEFDQTMAILTNQVVKPLEKITDRLEALSLTQREHAVRLDVHEDAIRELRQQGG